ncbi:MAG TPA: hypothetical protein VNF51_01815 [Candidatus Paceibacterota bacterium]|nr:hypothetical protein [Candidatus Paceibacterota bacterium]
MKEKINTYFAILLVTIAGSGAALLIVHVATTDAIAATFGGSETVYAPLQRSILNQK